MNRDQRGESFRGKIRKNTDKEPEDGWQDTLLFVSEMLDAIVLSPFGEIKFLKNTACNLAFVVILANLLICLHPPHYRFY